MNIESNIESRSITTHLFAGSVSKRIGSVIALMVGLGSLLTPGFAGHANAAPPASLRAAPDAPEGEVVVDDGDAGTSESTANWITSNKWSRACPGYGGDARWTQTRRIGYTNDADAYVWRPDLPTQGQYDVYVFWPGVDNGKSDTKSARYKVHHSGGELIVPLSQSGNWCQWKLLGTYSFNAGREGFVRLGDYTAENPQKALTADAVKFVLKAATPPRDTTKPDGRVVLPAEGTTIGPGSYAFTANAQDEQGGSGVSHVEFHIFYDGQWHKVCDDNGAPYECSFTTPSAMNSQQLIFTIHVIDNASNRHMDPGGYRRVQFVRPATPPQANPLPVPYVDQVFVQQRQECFSNGKCYWNHCGPSSVAMLLGYEGKETRDVFSNRQPTLDLVCKVKDHCKGAAVWGRITQTLKDKGLSATYKWASSFNDIKASIDKGHPVVMGIGQADHVLTVIGYKGNNIVTVNDPYGAKEWWKDTNRRGANSTDANGKWFSSKYLPAQPQHKGYLQDYKLGSELTSRHSIIVTGPKPVYQATSAMLSYEAQSMSAGGASFNLPAWEGAVQNQMMVNSIAVYTGITVTHEPLSMPTHSTQQFDVVLSTFKLTSADAQGQSYDWLGEPYEASIELDPNVLALWQFKAGLTDGNDEGSADDSDATPLMNAPSAVETSDAPLSADDIALMMWDDVNSEWIEVPAEINLETFMASATSHQMGEFAVVIKAKSESVTEPVPDSYQIFLPMVSP